MNLTRLALALVMVLSLGLGVVQAQDEPGTIVDIAVADGRFTTLVAAVEAAGLVDVLADPDAEWTVFAPTDDAFAALPEGTIDMLLADIPLLTRILTYHVVEGAVTSDQLSDMMAPSMEMTAPGADLMGSELDIQVGDDGSVMVNDANVIIADIIASNGVIHVIDSVLLPPDVAAMMAGDMGDMMGDYWVWATLNPTDLVGDSVVLLNDDLSMNELTFDGFSDIASIESVKFTSDGTAYVTVAQTADIGGVVVIDGLANADSMAVGTGTRFIGGVANAGLVGPKGLEIIEDLDLVLVANTGSSNIKGFSLSAEGDATPTVFIDNFGGFGGSIWDVHYDATTDTLFAAGTTGGLFVYRDFSVNMGADGPTNTIVPADADGNQISINLHGVDYDAASDTLLLTDVGLADDNTDGQLFTIAQATLATGNTPVTARIYGPDTWLGNPVDLVFDGQSIIVAEKANDMILVYNDILSLSGDIMTVADVVQQANKPESVDLIWATEMMTE